MGNSMARTRMKRAPTKCLAALLRIRSNLRAALVASATQAGRLGLGVEWIGLRRGRRRFRSGNVEVYDDGFLAAAHHHGFHRFIAASIQFLVWHVRRHIIE